MTSIPTRTRRRLIAAVAGILAFVAASGSAHAQIVRTLLDPNVATESELQTLPHMTPALVKSLVQRRPFMSAIELNAFLLDQKLTPAQTTEVYRKAFVHVNLNTGTRDEFLLIPGAGPKMAHEFDEYRPWKTWAQFDKEIAKYVGKPETDRLKQYVFIPINLNTAGDADLLTIPGAGQRMVHEFKEYRPWTSKAQFEKEISKYVGPKETARFWRYVVIQ